MVPAPNCVLCVCVCAHASQQFICTYCTNSSVVLVGAFLLLTAVNTSLTSTQRAADEYRKSCTWYLFEKKFTVAAWGRFTVWVLFSPAGFLILLTLKEIHWRRWTRMRLALAYHRTDEPLINTDPPTIIVTADHNISKFNRHVLGYACNGRRLLVHADLQRPLRGPSSSA